MPIFSNSSDNFYENEEEEESSQARSEMNLSIHERSQNLKNQLDLKHSDMDSVTELLEKGLTETISKLRKQSSCHSSSVLSATYNPSRNVSRKHSQLDHLH
jgi:hypothetical protein